MTYIPENFDPQCGIYMIKNIRNGKKYIGSTRQANARKNAHFKSLGDGKHHCVYLQRAWDKEGDKSVFQFSMFIYCKREELKKIEQGCINTMSPEYNTSKNAYRPDSEILKESGRKGYEIFASSRNEEELAAHHQNCGYRMQQANKEKYTEEELLEIFRAGGKKGGTKSQAVQSEKYDAEELFGLRSKAGKIGGRRSQDILNEKYTSEELSNIRGGYLGKGREAMREKYSPEERLEFCRNGGRQANLKMKEKYTEEELRALAVTRGKRSQETKRNSFATEAEWKEYCRIRNLKSVRSKYWNKLKKLLAEFDYWGA